MNDPAKVEHEVSLHMQELGIKLYSRTTAEEILKYPYPKVVQLLFYFALKKRKYPFLKNVFLDFGMWM